MSDTAPSGGGGGGMVVAQLQIILNTQTGQAAVQLTNVGKLVDETAGKVKAAGASAAGSASGFNNMGGGALRAASTMNSAFMFAGQPLGPLQNGVMNITNALQAASTMGDKFGRWAVGLGGIAMGLGAVGVAAVGPLNKADANLKTAFANINKNIDDYKGAIGTADKKGADFGFSVDHVNQALARLVTGFQDPNKALHELGVAEDLARLKHTSLEDATNTLVRTNAGYARGLRDLGISQQISKDIGDKIQAVRDSEAKKTESAAKAHERLQEALDKQHGKADLSVADGYRIANAQDAIAKATQGVTDTSARQDAALADKEAQRANSIAKANEHLQEVLARVGSAKNHTAAMDGEVAAAEKRVTDAQNARYTSSSSALRADEARTRAADGVTAANKRLQRAEAELASGHGNHAAQVLAVKHAEENLASADAALRESQEKSKKKIDEINGKYITSQQALDLVEKRTKGSAKAFSDTFSGTLESIKAHVTNFFEEHGQAMAQWGTTTGSVLMGIGALHELQLGQKALSVVHGLGKGYQLLKGFIMATAVEEEGFAAISLIGPLAIFALIAGAAYLIVTHWKEIGKFFSDVGHEIVHIFDGVLDWLKKNWQTALEVIIAFIVPGGIFMAAFWRWHDDIFKVIGEVLGFIEGIPGKILHWFSNAFNWLFNAGKDIVTGLWNGIKDVWHTVENWVTDRLNDLKNLPAKIFGLASPSKVYRQQGAWIMQGLRQGLESEFPATHRMMQDAMSALVSVGGGQGITMKVGAAAGALRLPVGVGAPAGGNVWAPHIEVHGSILTQRDLQQLLRDEVVYANRNNGGRYYGGTA